ncbi:MAG: alpha/beta fold hydrolase [Betaproteobacteria bacterium]|nr:alpha/beta fold hydrolase [Betaproteobacteria bacterium]
MSVTYKHPLVLSNHSTDPSKINASIIWLHGLGADGYDFEPVVTQLLRLAHFSNTRFVLPHAPEMPVTLNGGYIMPAWYDIYGERPITKEDEAGIKDSAHYISQLIQHEINHGVAANRIVLAGFSQGGAIALHTALRFPQTLAGVLALSTYLPLQSQLALEASPANAHTPILMAHGIDDDVISLEMSQSARNLLLRHQYPVIWREYDMAHALCLQEIDDIQHFLQQVLP